MYQNDTVPLHRRRTPSFSSTLLDAICRSIDESNPYRDDEFGTIQNHNTHSRSVSIYDFSIEQNGAIVTESSVYSNSISSSSDSGSRGGGCGGVFSSSDDSESNTKTTISSILEEKPKTKIEGGFSKTKLIAKKLYSELKKVKQPISPGGSISRFWNSIFSSGNDKKVKSCSVGGNDDVITERKPNLRGNQNSNKCIYKDDPGLMAIRKEDLWNGGRYIRNYQNKKKISEIDFRGYRSYVDENDDEEDDGSCSSSDLFELDHLTGIGRLRDELPVYETTNFKTNQAIANGFIL